MKRNSQRLFMMEMVLCILILVISLSVTNMIFVRSMTTHQSNEAMMKMSERMVMITEEIQSSNSENVYTNSTIMYFDSNGNEVENDGLYTLYFDVKDENTYQIVTLNLFTLKSEKLLSWDVVKVVE